MLYRGHAQICLFFFSSIKVSLWSLVPGSCETSNDGFSAQRWGSSRSSNQQLGGAQLNPQDVKISLLILGLVHRRRGVVHQTGLVWLS